MTTRSPAAATTTPSSAEGAEAQTFGDGCAQVPTDGAGSFDGMVKDPVATAASNNPLLATLVAAVGAVDGLGDTLNGAEALTVFAPFNGAFEEIPPADLNALARGRHGRRPGQHPLQDPRPPRASVRTPTPTPSRASRRRSPVTRSPSRATPRAA